jgi:hypothetical protein
MAECPIVNIQEKMKLRAGEREIYEHPYEQLRRPTTMKTMKETQQTNSS